MEVGLVDCFKQQPFCMCFVVNFIFLSFFLFHFSHREKQSDQNFGTFALLVLAYALEAIVAVLFLAYFI